MRTETNVICALALAAALAGGGCARQRCLESYAAMQDAQAVRQDGELLSRLVDHRRAAAEVLQRTGEQRSDSGDLVRSVQAWEMAMATVFQLQNLSRREEHAAALAEHRELASQIRCEARGWVERPGHLVSARAGMRMLDHQRALEAVFGSQGRPTDSQLTAIAEGREIYMGPVEEDIDVPQEAGGTGPSEAGGAPPGDEPEAGEDSGAAVDELLGE